MITAQPWTRRKALCRFPLRPRVGRSILSVVGAVTISVGVMVAAIAAPVSAHAQPASAPSQAGPADEVTIAEGHLDMGPRLIDGRWTIQVRDDTVQPVVWRPLEKVTLRGTEKAKLAVPSSSQFAFLGQPGSSVWLLPQVQQPGIVWPGWNTQAPEIVERMGREVTWKLHSVQGPGTFHLFLNENFANPRILFDSTKPFPQETGIETNTHVHGAWAFSAPGRYQLGISMEGVAKDGTKYYGTGTVRINVGSDAEIAAAPTGPVRGTPPSATSAAPATTAQPATTARSAQTPASKPGETNKTSETSGIDLILGLAIAGTVVVLGALALAVFLRARTRR